MREKEKWPKVTVIKWLHDTAEATVVVAVHDHFFLFLVSGALDETSLSLSHK